MKKKLWISSSQYMEVSDDRSTLAREIAPRSRSVDWFGLYAFLPDPDPVLMKLGQDMRVYRQLLSDAHVGSCYINRKSATLSSEWEIQEPAGNLKRVNRMVMDLVNEVMDGLDVYQVITDILDAPFYGMSPMEILWRPEAEKWIPTDVVGRPPEWFQFTEDNELRFKSKENLILGEEIPEHKFLLPRHHASYLNPYGDRVLSRCFWPVVFKKGGLKYWAIFAEKYGMPWIVGKVPGSTNETERAALLTNLASMVQDAVAVINNDESIELKESGGKQASADIYQKLVDVSNKEISKAIMGQTASTEGTPGKLGGDDAQMEVRGDLAGQDQRMVSETFDRFFRWITDLNFGPDTAAPEFGWYQEEDVQKNRAERDKTLHEAGLRFTKIYYQRRYNLEEDEFEVTEGTTTEDGRWKTEDAAGGQPPFGAFAESDPGTRAAVAGQNRLDELTDRSMDAGIKVFGGLADDITALVEKARSLQAAKDGLVSLYKNFDIDRMAAGLSAAMANAERLGSESAGGSAFADALWGPGTPFREAIDYFRARAFTVAGISGADALQDIADEVQRAIEDGTTLDDFRAGLGDLLQRRGLKALSPWRVETIYRTNLQGAFQAGRYRQMTDPAVKAFRPYWRYVAVMDGSTRPAHAAMNGKIFPSDHEFWDNWYPPNGFNCRCTVTTLSERELARNGWSVETEDPTGTLIEPVDPATGNRMPAQLVFPDPGWRENPAAKMYVPDLSKYDDGLRAVVEKRIRPQLGKIKNAG